MVLAASYPDVASAEADYEAVKALYQEIRTSHDFDAAVISRDEDGKVHVVKKHESNPGPIRPVPATGRGRKGGPADRCQAPLRPGAKVPDC
jgi:hypothetical protein